MQNRFFDCEYLDWCKVLQDIYALAISEIFAD